MKQCKTRKTSKQLVYILLIIIASLAISQTIQTSHAQTTNNQWGMGLQIRNVGENSTSNIFSPFDQIQLNSHVTFNNASQPDMLVYFNVTGPSGSSNPTTIGSVETTNSSGQAGFSFRLPIESNNESSLVGNWQAFATMQTTNGSIQQNVNFTTQWNMQITSINLLNAQGQNQTTFTQGSPVTVQLTISNTGQPQTANITLNMQDQQGNTINQTQILNSQISTSSTDGTQLQTDLQIPDGTAAGQMTINAAIYSGSYLNTDIPAAENQTAYFTVASNTTTTTTTATPTPTPTSGPTPTPTIVENSVSLFSWLLVATGLFTFTSLLVFLKRKSSPIISQTPVFAPSTPNPATATSALGQSTAPQETSQQPTLQMTVPTSKIAPEKVMEATVMSEINLNEPTEAQSKFAATIEVGKPDLEPALAQEPVAQAALTFSSRISSATKRIQTIKTTIESEREQLAQDLTELNKLVDEREIAVKNYFLKVREEMEKAKTHLTDTEDSLGETAKPNSASNLSQEPTLQAILTYRSRIANTEKIIQALKIALKLEKEKLAPDLIEFHKQVDEREKTLKKYIDSLRQEIEKAETYLNDKED